jgi:hypothetical protein
MRCALVPWTLYPWPVATNDMMAVGFKHAVLPGKGGGIGDTRANLAWPGRFEFVALDATLQYEVDPTTEP